MPVTVLDIVSDAMREAGILIGSETPNAPDAAIVMQRLNDVLELWGTERNNIYTISIATYSLAVSRTSYTIGRGTSPAANFVADRPLGPGPGNGIESANIILTGVTPNVRVPLAILDDDQWASVSVTAISSTIPVALYNDGGFPNSSLYLWPYPSGGNSLELFTRQQLGSFTALTDTFAYPPGYRLAIVGSLAEAICPLFGKEISATLEKSASKARAKIKSLNTAPPFIATADYGLGPKQQDRGTFNYRTGQNV